MTRLVLVEAIHPLDEVAPYISLGYLASYLNKHEPGVEFAHTRSFGKLGIEIKPDDVVCITSFTQNFNSALCIARDVKSRDSSVPVIVGGNHVTFLPESMSEDMDVAAIGEGEETLLEVVRSILEHGFDGARLSEVAGLAFLENGKVRRTETRPLLNDLDLIPPPMRSLTHKHRNYRRIEMITSRGCPYKCIYCGSSALWGQRVRFHSVEYVIAEMEDVIQQYRPEWLYFVDDLFVAKKDRVADIMNHIRRKGYNKSMKFYFTAHSNMVSDELCQLLEGVPCFIGMGLESGSNKILKSIKTGNVSVEKNREALDILSRYDNIAISGAFMVGLPDETEEDMEMTYDFIVNSPIKEGAVSVVTPFPGTQLWDYALDRGKVDIHMDWEKMRFNDKTSLKNKLIIDEAVTIPELEKMLHRINAALYRRYIQNSSLEQMFLSARMTPTIIIKNVISNPRKVFTFAAQYFQVTIKEACARVKSRLSSL